MADEKKGGKLAWKKACEQGQQATDRKKPGQAQSPVIELTRKKAGPDRLEYVDGRPTIQKPPSKSDLKRAKPTGDIKPAPDETVRPMPEENAPQIDAAETAEERVKPKNPTIPLSDKDVDDAEKEEALSQWKSKYPAVEQQVEDLWRMIYDVFNEVEIAGNKQEMLNDGLKIAFAPDRQQSDEAEERVTGMMHSTNKKTQVRLDDMYKLVQDLKKFRTPYEKWMEHLARMEGHHESTTKDVNQLRGEVAALKEQLSKKGKKGLFR